MKCDNCKLSKLCEELEKMGEGKRDGNCGGRYTPTTPTNNRGDYISRVAAMSVPPLPKEHREYQTGNLDDAYELGWDDALQNLKNIPPADVLPVPSGGIGEVSDGYHTFHGLYYQRMILFAALIKQNREKAWKSYKHSDGEPCFGGGWFIVGIDTPEGSYTYHYEDKDWDLFECEELPAGKHWDGHTEDDVTRLLSLPEQRPVVLCRKCKYLEKRSPDVLICQHPKNDYHAQACFCELDDFCSYGEAGEWDGRYC